MKSVRLWVRYRNGYVRLKLTEGQPLYFHYSEATDEGYSFAAEEYYLEGDVVVCNSVSGGRDCDGEIRHSTSYECEIGELYYWEHDSELFMHKPIRTPYWREIGSMVYDQHAQSMGY